MRKGTGPRLLITVASGLFGWEVASVTIWWGGLIAFVCMVSFLLLVIAGGDTMGSRSLGGKG